MSGLLRGLVVVVAALATTACCLQPSSEGSTGTTGFGGSSGSASSGGTTGAPPPAGPAYIMIVQDTSGSMCEPIQATTPSGQSCLSTTGPVAGYCSNCSPGEGTCADSIQCASQLQLVSNSMLSILNSHTPTVGQFEIGLASFPGVSSDTCGTGAIQIPVGDAVTTLPKITQFYGSAAPNGGAPMAATLAVAALDPALANPDPTARKFILLVTDGLPNCATSSACTAEPWSDGKPWGCASPAEVAARPGVSAAPTPPAGCTCSFGSCAAVDTASCCPVTSGPDEAQYCLDDQNTEAEIATLYSSQHITTYVIGIGYDYASDPAVLNAMAAAGHGSANAYQAATPAAIQALLASLIQGGG